MAAVTSFCNFVWMDIFERNGRESRRCRTSEATEVRSDYGAGSYECGLPERQTGRERESDRNFCAAGQVDVSQQSGPWKHSSPYPFRHLQNAFAKSSRVEILPSRKPRGAASKEGICRPVEKRKSLIFLSCRFCCAPPYGAPAFDECQSWLQI
jgi:hypothetical protein